MWAMEVNRIASIDTIEERFAIWTVLSGNWETPFPKFTAPIQRKIASLLPIGKEARVALYAANGLPSPMECSAGAQRLRGIARVERFGLAGNNLDAARAGIRILKGMLDGPALDFSTAAPFCDALNRLRLPPDSDEIRREVIALSYYFGLYSALWKGYTEIIAGLTLAAEEAIAEIDWMIEKGWEIRVIGGIGIAKAGVAQSRLYFKSRALHAEWIDQLDDQDQVSGGVVVQPAVPKVIPVRIEANPVVSYCSGPLVGESVFLLEDGETAMSSREALMWFDVTPFSPLKTHQMLSVY
jgi:hypothetical protein